MEQLTEQFNKLLLPISPFIKSYSEEQQKEILAYLEQLDQHHQKTYKIAFEHLGSSFNIYKSNGFKEWKASKK